MRRSACYDGRWLGPVDFLTRVESPSELGAWSYEVADAKLAREAKASPSMERLTARHPNAIADRPNRRPVELDDVEDGCLKTTLGGRAVAAAASALSEILPRTG